MYPVKLLIGRRKRSKASGKSLKRLAKEYANVEFHGHDDQDVYVKCFIDGYLAGRKSLSKSENMPK